MSRYYPNKMKGRVYNMVKLHRNTKTETNKKISSNRNNIYAKYRDLQISGVMRSVKHFNQLLCVVFVRKLSFGFRKIIEHKLSYANDDAKTYALRKIS